MLKKSGATLDFDTQTATGIEFSARTRMSGTDLADGREIRKGAVDAIKGFVRSRGGQIPTDLDAAYERVSRLGGTPLALCQGDDIYGVIYLKVLLNLVSANVSTKCDKWVIRTVMLTGDNQITASVHRSRSRSR